MKPLVPDLLAPDLALVFCGSAPSSASAKAHSYYAKPGNIFWPTLARTGITPRLFAPTDYAALLSLSIGLTDVCKTASGNDDELPPEHIRPDLLSQKIEHYRPKLLAFTSKHSAQLALGRKVEYGLQPIPHPTGTRIYVCCSTSGRARRFWREDVWVGLYSLYNSIKM